MFMPDLYAGLNACHNGHQGLSVAKLVHAVVTYHDMMMGSGMW